MRSPPMTTGLLRLARRDATLAAVLGAIVLAASLADEGSWPAAIGSSVLCLPLAWRTRRPLEVLGVVALGLVALLTFTDPSPACSLTVAVALYSVAAHGDRRRTLAVGAGLLVAVIAIVLLFSPGDESPLQQMLQSGTQLGFALAIGEAVRTQRALFAAMRERAVRAEHEGELEARRRVNEERVRIARDVHDVVAHSLATVSTQASVGVHVGRDEPERAVEVLEAIKAVSTGALDDLRYALGALRDDALDAPVGPTPAMEDLASGKPLEPALLPPLDEAANIAPLPNLDEVASTSLTPADGPLRSLPA